MATRSMRQPPGRGPAGQPLSSFASGEEAATIFRITEEAEEDAALLSYLEARGLQPGAAVVVRASSDVVDAITVDGPRGSATLGLRPASLVLALPGKADPALFQLVPSPGRRAAEASARGTPESQRQDAF